LIYKLCAGNGSLADLDALACDSGAIAASGMTKSLNSRRASEHLGRLTDRSLAQLQGVCRQLCASIVASRAQELQDTLGYVPVFVDGSAIEVRGKQFEDAKTGYNAQQQYWLHGVFVGDVWASCRLHPGATDVASSWREQLDSDVALHMPKTTKPWLRMDNAYYPGEVVQWARDKAWDYSISVTNDNNKAPVLRQLRGDSGHVWRRINDDEQTALVWHTPSGWASPNISRK